MEPIELESEFISQKLNNNSETNLIKKDKSEIIEGKIYKLSLKKTQYILIIEYKNDSKIYFYLKQDDDNIDDYFLNVYEKNVIKNKIDLEKIYDNIKKIYDFFIDLLERGKILLERDEFNKGINLTFKRDGEIFGDSYYHVPLPKSKDNGNLIFYELLSELNKDEKKELKFPKKYSEDLGKRIERLEEKLNLSKKNKEKMQNKDIKDSNNKKNNNKKEKDNSINEIKLESNNDNKIEFDDNNEDNIIIPQKDGLENFTEEPFTLKYDYYLTTNISSSEDELNNFDVFIGVEDHIYYLIYNNLRNNHIEIINIFNKNIIKSLPGHHTRTSVIKYYLNHDKGEYILSCDINSKAIIWDVANDFEVKYILRMADTGLIKDAILLLDINKKNYLIISRHNKTEYTKLYQLKKDASFVSNIYNSNKNMTYKLIPWKYKDQYFIIELCKGCISIKNIFKNENHIKLNLEKTDIYLSGFLYKDNQLVANNSYDKSILIFDLVNKIKKGLISYTNSGYSLLHWNDKYTIVMGNNIEIIDLEKNESVKRISYTNSLYGVKKIKSQLFGEAIISSDSKQNLVLFSLFNK